MLCQLFSLSQLFHIHVHYCIITLQILALQI